MERAALAIAVLLLCAAPTPGDIGSCGQPVQELDAETFFSAKAYFDCRRCNDCRLVSKACTAACDPDTVLWREFDEGCLPLVHDGEVCLRALRDASCEDYGTFVRDSEPETPTECNFCPRMTE
jgi:hypothetical protein